jgi:hypothetical protein
VESDVRFYRRRANEELAAANRAVTHAAKERRMIMAGIFLDRLKMVQSSALAELALTVPEQGSVFSWSEGRSVESA